MPESARKSRVRWDICRTEDTGPVAAAIAQVKTSTTDVRRAVAKWELIPVTPILARIAVIPAKNAESKAQVTQFIPPSLRQESRVVNARPRTCKISRLGA